MPSLKPHFDKSRQPLGILFRDKGGQGIFAPMELISYAFDKGNGESIVAFKNEKTLGLPRLRVGCTLDELKGFIPQDDYIEFMADADDWNVGISDLAVHPYLVMRSAVQNYKLGNEQIVAISVMDPWSLSRTMDGVTQIDKKTKDFLQHKFGTTPDQYGWVSGQTKQELGATCQPIF